MLYNRTNTKALQNASKIARKNQIIIPIVHIEYHI